MRTPIEWDQLFLQMASLIAKRSKDESTQVGAVLVSKDNVVLSMGFNGPPACMVDSDIPWNVRPAKYAYIIHAEENALLFALEQHGKKPLTESKMYCTHDSCTECLLRCMRAGIKEIVNPESTPPYPLSKYQVDPLSLIEAQKYPRINLRKVAT